MNVNIDEMSLSQALGALLKFQTWADQARKDRMDFIQEWGERGSGASAVTTRGRTGMWGAIAGLGATVRDRGAGDEAAH